MYCSVRGSNPSSYFMILSAINIHRRLIRCGVNGVYSSYRIHLIWRASFLKKKLPLFHVLWMSYCSRKSQFYGCSSTRRRSEHVYCSARGRFDTIRSRQTCTTSVSNFTLNLSTRPSLYLNTSGECRWAVALTTNAPCHAHRGFKIISQWSL